MTAKERLVKCESISRRQNSGQITPAEASLEVDEFMMSEDPTGTLIYYGDSTGLTADWDRDVMLFPKPGATFERRLPSNTGIYARGPKRGFLITHPANSIPDCNPGTLAHFTPGSKGWIGKGQ